MRHISFRADGKARRTLIAVMVVILFEVMRMPGADAQSISVSRAFDLFSQFCLKEFPDVPKISDAVKRADWKFISGDADVACKDNSFCGSSWHLIEESSKALVGIELKSLFGRSQCILSFSGDGFPLQKISEMHDWKEDADAGQRLSDKLKNYRVFRAQLGGKPLNFVFVNSFDIPAYHEMIVTQIRILDSDPKN